jgi:hypothetical protein
MRHVTRACAWSLERVIVLALAACALVVGPEFRRVRGIIDIGDARSRTVVAPDTVMVGVSFLVDATTFGSGSCTLTALPSGWRRSTCMIASGCAGRAQRISVGSLAACLCNLTWRGWTRSACAAAR